MIYILNPYGTVNKNSIASVIYNTIHLLPDDTKVISYDLNDFSHTRYVNLFNTSSLLYRTLKFTYNLVPYRFKTIYFKKKYGFIRFDFMFYRCAFALYLKNKIRHGDIIILHAYPALLKQLLAFRKYAKVLVYLHNNDLEYYKNDLKYINEDYFGLYNKYSDGVIVLNDKPYNELLKKEFYTTWVINNLVPPPPDYSINNEKADFIYSGRLVPQKYIFELCSAFAQAFSATGSYKLYLAGEFDSDKYKNEVLDKFGNISNIIFLGKLSKDNLFKVQSSTKYTLLISESEGSPLSLLEGASLGNRLIASDIVGCREILSAYGGYLIDNTDIETNLKLLFGELKESNHVNYIKPNIKDISKFTSANYAFRFNSVIKFFEIAE